MSNKTIIASLGFIIVNLSVSMTVEGQIVRVWQQDPTPVIHSTGDCRDCNTPGCDSGNSLQQTQLAEGAVVVAAEFECGCGKCPAENCSACPARRLRRGCGCGPGACGNGCQNGCCPQCGNQLKAPQDWCELKISEGKEDRTCYKTEQKTICIPAIRFPWEKCGPAKCGKARTVNVLSVHKFQCPTCKYEWSVNRADIGTAPCASDAITSPAATTAENIPVPPASDPVRSPGLKVRR